MPELIAAEPLPRLRWSAATAAFQIEGARTEGGRGRSIWDDFVETAGAVRDGSTAEPGPEEDPPLQYPVFQGFRPGPVKEASALL